MTALVCCNSDVSLINILPNIRLDILAWEDTSSFYTALLITGISLSVALVFASVICCAIKNKSLKISSFPILFVFFFILFGQAITSAYKGHFDEPQVSSAPIVFKGEACDGSGCYLNEVLVLNSEINDTSANELISKHNKNKDIKTICFNSRGGETSAAIKIINHIQFHDLSTCLADKYIGDDGVDIIRKGQTTVCQSACPLILIAANNRLRIGRKQSLGVHHTGTEIKFGIFSFKYNCGGTEYIEAYKDEPLKAAFVEFTRIPPYFEKFVLTQKHVNKFKIFTEDPETDK